jgi:hypothetical protein
VLLEGNLLKGHIGADGSDTELEVRRHVRNSQRCPNIGGQGHPVLARMLLPVAFPTQCDQILFGIMPELAARHDVVDF